MRRKLQRSICPVPIHGNNFIVNPFKHPWLLMIGTCEGYEKEHWQCLCQDDLLLLIGIITEHRS